MKEGTEIRRVKMDNKIMEIAMLLLAIIIVFLIGMWMIIEFLEKLRT